jgi:2-C-methyl-D-erythritol 4-phosphate cytidylyltransferase
MELCGLPVIVRTLIAFQESEVIDEIIVAAKSDEIEIYSNFEEKYKLTKLAAVISGGDTRQESVLRGFEKISDKSEFVAIHDGARCLIGTEAINSVVRAAYHCGAATAASKVSDTVKRCNFNGFVEETIDRDSLWLAQTPQVFKTDLYRAAAYIARDEDFKATDDNLLAEHIGFPVKLVDCGSDNIKITTPADLAVAEVILRRRKIYN